MLSQKQVNELLDKTPEELTQADFEAVATSLEEAKHNYAIEDAKAKARCLNNDKTTLNVKDYIYLDDKGKFAKNRLETFKSLFAYMTATQDDIFKI
jgi:hypothetical protein